MLCTQFFYLQKFEPLLRFRYIDNIGDGENWDIKIF